jgi:DNA-binding transcriptional LysR family regulator
MDDWSDLDVFHAVAEEGSLAAAARRLGVSHPTIGRRLEALEMRLGGQLVVRGAAGIELTPLGQAIQDNVRRMGEEADAIHRLAGGGQQGLAGVVSVSALDGMGASVIPRLLAELRAGHPDLMFRLDVSSRAANLARREADIALRLFRPGDQASLVARRVARLGIGFYASPAYLDARGRPERIAELARHDAVIANAALERLWTPVIAGEPAEPRCIAFDSDSLPGLLAAAEAGLGIAVQSHWRARGRRTLERVLPQVELPPADLWLVTHADIRRSARVRLVLDHLAERFSANARWLAEGDGERPERFE